MKWSVAMYRAEIRLQISAEDPRTRTGMSKETLAKLWTPLFTTNAKGMDLGLAICIVDGHGGSMSVESTVGRGTTVTIELPIKPAMETLKEGH